MKKIRIALAFFVGIILTGFFLICVAYCLPTERASMNVRKSGELLEKESLYKYLVVGDGTTKLDNFTDIIMMLTTVYDGQESAVEKAVNNYRVTKKDSKLSESCSVCGQIDSADQEKESYARYWHGYVIILKPLLMLFTLNEIRSINLLVIVGYLCMIAIMLYKRGCSKYIIPFLLACCIINPMTVSVSLQFSTIFHVTAIAIIVLLLFFDKNRMREMMWLYFMVIGMLTSYFDFLTYPLVSMAFPLILYFALNENIVWVEGIKKLLSYSVMWSIGYVGMWGSKWAISSVIMKKNYFIDAINTIQFRTGNHVVTSKEDTVVTVLQVYTKIIDFVKNNSLKYAIIIVLFVCIVALFKFNIRTQNMAASSLILIIAVYPFIWYVGTKNHSYIHTYAYRNLAVCVFAITSCLMPMIDFGKRKNVQSEINNDR